MDRLRFRTVAVLLCFWILVFGVAAADGLSVDAVAYTLRPGQSVLLGFDVPEAGTATLLYQPSPDSAEVLSVVVIDLQVKQGRNGVWWNGTYNGQPAPEGEGYLVLVQGENQTATPLKVGPPIPQIQKIRVSDTTLTPKKPVSLSFDLSCAGEVELLLTQEDDTVLHELGQMTEGLNTVVLDGAGRHDGSAAVSVRLTDAWGLSAESSEVALQLTGFAQAAAAARETAQPEEEVVLAELEADAPIFTDIVPEPVEMIEEEEVIIGTNDQHQYTPNFGSPWYGSDPDENYWTLPMDITDEAAVWRMLMDPITVVDTGKKNAEKTQVVIRAEPDEKAGGVGVVTCVSQGVHVLKTLDNGWSLIECYSSSFHDSKIKAWNLLVQGYVQTSLLKTTVPNQEMGLVIDKLTQRLYIFKEGHLFSTLQVSTGLANARQPYNETRSGEFILLLPAVGEFRSDNLYCSMAIRFNDGDLLHEVPHMKNKDGSKNFSTTEYKLGTRGSHGCIRVQRKLTPEGTNMLWLWRNKKKNMKLVIWEDWQGRQMSYPADDTVVYYNPKKGESYHAGETCNAARGVVFSPLTYGELEMEPYQNLTRCPFCNPPLRRGDIDQINLLHAPGGDHDPILTEARSKQPAVQ